jgi:hypothetical protein
VALLQHRYWQKFLFDPVADLRHYA